jgi:hypothetical protein
MQWDLYCRVVDNFGDIGVAWRLAADLAARGESVRLAVDDARALAWMAADGAAGVTVVGWEDGPSAATDVVVELFGGGRPHDSWPATGEGPAPLLVNVEHLTAEPYAERSRPAVADAATGRAAVDDVVLLPDSRRRAAACRAGGARAQARLLESDAWLPRRHRRDPEGGQLVLCQRRASGGFDVLTEPTPLLATAGPAAEQVEACLGLRSRAALRAALPLIPQADFDICSGRAS